MRDPAFWETSESGALPGMLEEVHPASAGTSWPRLCPPGSRARARRLYACRPRQRPIIRPEPSAVSLALQTSCQRRSRGQACLRY